MAKKYAKPVDESPEDKERAKEKKKKTGENKEILKRLRDCFQVATEADDTNRREALDDLRFVHEPGAQWDAVLKKERGDRPCYEFNKLRITIKRVINHIRANRPQGKVRAVEDGDKDTADIYDGLLRNIWNVSDADTVVDYAAEYVVAGGMGAWRVTTEYSDDTVFEQDIFIRPIKNPFCLYADPSASDPIKRDAEYWLLTERISKSSFKARWPNAEPVDFEDVSFEDDEDWEDDETVRICEYWYKKPAEKTLYLLADGKTVDELPPGVQAVKERRVKCPKICMVIASGDTILEGPTEWAGKHFPFIQVFGEWRVIDGKTRWHGLTRFSKDAQRAYNSSRTAIAETIALAPTAKNWMTPKQFEGLGDHIAEAHKKNIPVSFYNPDPNAPGPPARIGGADVPVALIQEANMASEDIKATSGIFDASLGQHSNETSGRAIRARQEQGEIATYNFPDNIAKGVRRTDEILIDLIPHIYDTARSIRILGADGAEKYHRINTPVQQPDGTVTTLNDITRGKYDVTVTTGPSYSTQRQEAAEIFTQMASAFPPIMQVAGDLVLKNMDVPMADEFAERLRFLLPPQIQQQLAEGKPVPAEVQAVMTQAQQMMQVAQQQAQLVQEAAAEVEEGKAEADKAKAAVDQAISQLKVEKANFEAIVAKAQAQLMQKEVALNVKDAQLSAQESSIAGQAEEAEAGASEANIATQTAAQAVDAIQDFAQRFMQVAAEILVRLEQSQAAAANKPKTTRQIQARRGPTGLDFTMSDVDEAGQVVSTRSGNIARNGPDLMGQLT